MDDRLSLAIKYYQSNLDEQAWALVSELISEPDPTPDVLSMGATLAFERRDLDLALNYCDLLLALQADDAHTLLIKGRALSDLDRHDDAVSCLEAAVAADDTLAAAHYNLGWVRQAMGNRDLAIASYRAAVSRQDPYPVAWNNLGLLLEDAGDGVGAESAFSTAIRQFPEFSAAYNNLGAVLAAGGQFRAAADAYAEALSVDSENLDARVNLGVAKLEQSDITGAIACFRDVLAKEPDHGAARSNALYAEIYHRDDDESLQIEHNIDGDFYGAPWLLESLETDFKPNRRLNIGFLSPDFRRHSVSFFSLPLVESLDSKYFNVHLFNDTAKADEITARFHSAAHVCHDVAVLSDDALFDLMRNQNLDVLVDLASRTIGNRTAVLARRCAPVQVTALGYPGPSGLQAMDYWLCDSTTNPVDAKQDIDRDRPLRLEGGLHVFGPPSAALEVSSLPAQRSKRITFGSFNKLAKISEPTVSLWSAVLNAVPDSHLFVKARALTEPETAAALLSRFENAGIDPSRIEMRGWAVEDSDHLALYHKVDIALDTIPYNGTTTTCEALWMGVPVLTLSGRGHAARVGASLLKSASLTDWACETVEQVVEKAKSSTQNIDELAALRAGLRTHLMASPLTDAPAYARSFEAALRSVWNARCDEAR